MVRNNPCIIGLQTARLEIGHLLLDSIMEVSSLLSIAVARLTASTSSRLRLLFPGAGHCGSTRSSFCAWPTVHHCGGHCQDRPGLMPGRSGPPTGSERPLMCTCRVSEDGIKRSVKKEIQRSGGDVGKEGRGQLKRKSDEVGEWMLKDGGILFRGRS